MNKVDRKGRVSVPAPFRAAVASQSFQGIVLFQSHQHPCLEGFDGDTMQEMSERLDHFDLFSAEQDDLATTIFGEAVQLPFDGDGRIIMPAALLDFAGIDEQAVFVGLGRKFQIWSPSTYEKRREAAQNSVKKQSLTLPKKEGS